MASQTIERRTNDYPAISRRAALLWMLGLSGIGLIAATETQTRDCTRTRTGYTSYPNRDLLPQIRERTLAKNPQLDEAMLNTLTEANLRTAQQRWNRIDSDCRVQTWKDMRDYLINSAKRFVRW